jgi:hypothetical protein
MQRRSMVALRTLNLCTSKLAWASEADHRLQRTFLPPGWFLSTKAASTWTPLRTRAVRGRT